ncbi:glutathione-specific gamma-glutamylcyclotransferase 1-like [Liolophura sinensis]|uniref:glutathione-specific gamma-glutamylcyclotransferase 1-like n=1 Tax=Liolophura sinensis TaxID=3198878 RepID=UPI003158BDF6
MSVTVSDNAESIWVFGYGSLTWKPGISYSSKHYGYIKGFKRRFWQGNTTHRGTPEQPGRVATLVPDSTTILWGVAYELKGKEQIQAGMENLTNREMRLGGYTTYVIDFYRRESHEYPIPTVVYTATPDSHLWMGPHNSLDQMALQIVTSHGTAGANSDYVTKLADFTRKYIPEETDEHLFLLDKKIRTLLATRHNVHKPSEKMNSKHLRPAKVHSEMVSIEKPFCIAKRISHNDEACDRTVLEPRVEMQRDE